MLELARRGVLDGLNRRYIYGRVVSVTATYGLFPPLIIQTVLNVPSWFKRWTTDRRSQPQTIPYKHDIYTFQRDKRPGK